MKFVPSGLILMTASALLAGCNTDEPKKPVPPQTAQARVVMSGLEQTPEAVKVTGSLHARESATLSTQVVGRLQQVLVHEGDFVSAGQTLAVLDDSTLRASNEQAEAAVKLAESQMAAAQTNADLAASTLARYKQLQAEKSVSPQEMDEVTRRAEAAAAQANAMRAQGNAAKAQVSGAKAMLAYTRIRAPFSGVISARMADPGTLAAPGVPLLQIDSAGPLQLQTNVDESVLGNIRKGMKLNLTVAGMQKPDVTGTVAEIVPAADQTSHSFLVKIDLPPSRELRAGMYGTAEIVTGKGQTIFVPQSTVVTRGALPCAYVIDTSGIAQLRNLTLGSAHGNRIEVLSGISGSEKLIDNPGDRDLAGKRIEVQP